MKKTNFRKLILRQLRDKRMPVAQLSMQSGVNIGSVWNYLKGKTQIRSDLLEKLLDTLKNAEDRKIK